MTTHRTQADVASLEKLLLGQLPVAETERLAVECADDARLAELAEALAGRDDTLLDSLRNHQTEVDPKVDSLVSRLIERLKGGAASQDSSNATLAMTADLPSAPQPMPAHLEYFRIQKVLGEGGMGTVYLADDTRLGRQVALKTLKRELAIKPAARDRFLREARSAARLEHDHVIPIYYVGEADGTPFLAMPFLQGEPLDQRIQRARDTGTLLPVAETVRIARQIATGLASAHAKKLIHRDIKPANVWLESPTGRVKILDFGLARTQQEDAHLTASGTIVGTPAYMAPEQGRGQSVDHRADLFSLGAVLYEMLTGNRPFTGPDTMSVLTSLAIDTPPTPLKLNPHCPLALSRLTMQLLAKQPDQRPASAQTVVDELAKIEVPAADATAVMTAPPPALAVNRPPETVSFASPPASPKRRSRILLFAAIAAVLALVPLGWWLATVILHIETEKGTFIVEIDDAETEARYKNGTLLLYGPDDKVRYTLMPSDRNQKIDAGPYKIRVEGADGLVLDTTEFTIKNGAKVKVRVTLDPKAMAKNLDADRKAAEYVLSIGGIVRVNDQDKDIKAAADLPKEPFRLTDVNLNENEQVSDAGLAAFKDCKSLTHLDLRTTKVSDAGLAHFKGCKDLTHLSLNGIRVGDAGLAHFAGCKELAHVSLFDTQVSDVGLAYLQGCKKLRQLWLPASQVSDAGLARFKEYNSLVGLDLGRTKVTDAGLVHLEDCKNLKWLGLQKTKVTAAKIEALKKALPQCRIDWDGGVIEPTVIADADRKAAECVLSIGGSVRIKETDNERQINAVNDLPRGAFELTLVRLGQNPKVSDAGLAVFKDCKNLTFLDLSQTQVSDAGLAYFKDCKNLTDLRLYSTSVSDVGLANFKDCKNLTHLDLDNTQVSDAGLANFKDCKNLMQLQLGAAHVGDVGLAHFKDCKNLTYLKLVSTQVSDAGLAHFKECKNLSYLDLQNTKVGDAGLAHFQGCKNLTSLNLDQTKVSDAGVKELAPLNRLRVLKLKGTKVTTEGIATLQKALPACQISSDVKPK